MTEAAAPAASLPHWKVRGRVVGLARPVILGIVNVTPDSFSDGGRFFSPEAAVQHGLRLLSEGADILDVGGESTRPQGAVPVDAREEIRRVLPVIAALRQHAPDCLLSVDTVKAEVAEAALESGADIVNDVSAFRLDATMAGICAGRGAGVILMHSRGGVSDMATYLHASYGDDVAGEVIAELMRQVDVALSAGVRREGIVLDPGIGFSKRSEHSLAVLRDLSRLASTGYPVLVGASRKRFVGEVVGIADPEGRDAATAGVNVAALERGARLFRVHDVRTSRQALDAAWAVIGGSTA